MAQDEGDGRVRTGEQEILPPEAKDRKDAKSGKVARAGAAATVATAADALNAVATIVTAVSDQKRVREEHRTMREAIRERSAVDRERISANRELLDAYVSKAFAGRDQAINGLMDALDVAVARGDADTAASVASAIADVVKTAPLIQAADLHQKADAGDPVFTIGGRR